MQYQIAGETLPVVTCQLAAGETMITERGSMSWMTPNMKMETTTNGGLGKAFGRLLAGTRLLTGTRLLARSGLLTGNWLLARNGLLAGNRLGSGLLFLLLVGVREDHLDAGHLVVLGQIVEDDGQLPVVQNLHVVLGRRGVFGQDLADGLGGQAEILCHLMDSVFFNRQSKHLV